MRDKTAMTMPVLVVKQDNCLDMYSLQLMAVGALRSVGLNNKAEELHQRCHEASSWSQMVELVEDYVMLRWP